MKFIISGIVLGIIAGVFPGLCLANMFDDTKKSHKVIIVIITIAIFSIICGLELKSDNYNFNNGYCVQCGTKYEAITHKNSQTYYECPNCHFGCWY